MSGAKLFQRKSLNHELKTETKEVSKVCWKVGIMLFNSWKSRERSTKLPKKLRLTVFRDFALNTPEASSANIYHLNWVKLKHKNQSTSFDFCLMAWAITLRKLNQNSTGGLKKNHKWNRRKVLVCAQSTYALSKRDFGYSASGCCRLPRGSSTVLDLTLAFFSQRVGEVAVYLQRS